MRINFIAYIIKLFFWLSNQIIHHVYDMLNTRWRGKKSQISALSHSAGSWECGSAAGETLAMQMRLVHRVINFLLFDILCSLSKHFVRHFLKNSTMFLSQNCSKASIIVKIKSKLFDSNGKWKSLTSRCTRPCAHTTERRSPRSRIWHAGRTMQSQMAVAFSVRLRRAH